MKVRVTKVHGKAKMPVRAYPTDAGMDLFCAENISIAVGERVQVSTGISMEIPEGFVGLIWDKSGLSQKAGLKTLGGVVDSQYRGEIKIGIINLSDKDFVFEKGQKVAQMLIQKVERVDLIESENLSDTSRGESGFGSTGL